jgi:hypothetical protein
LYHATVGVLLSVVALLDVTKYQSIVGSFQLTISLGRLNIAKAVMTMSSFWALPRVGHLERVKRIVGYLARMRHGVTHAFERESLIIRISLPKNMIGLSPFTAR